MDIDFTLLGSRIRKERINKGLTTDQLSEIVDLSADTLRHIEIGASKPSLNKLFHIAVALDVSLDYLTGRSPDRSGVLLDPKFKDLDLDLDRIKLLDNFISETIHIIVDHL